VQILKQVKMGAVLLLASLPVVGLVAAGVEAHTGESEFQNGKQEIRVLLPDDYSSQKQYPVLYVLPVVSGWTRRYDRSLDVLQKMDAHNRHDLIIVTMSFEKTPWYGDHAANPKIRQASYLKEHVVPFVEGRYSTIRRSDGRLLLGFSKSGWGAISLLLRNPDFFGYAAAWDSPMMLPDFHYSMDEVFGTREQLAQYRPDLLAVHRKESFQSSPRFVLLGENLWGTLIPAPGGGSHTTEFHRLLEQENVKHVFDGSLKANHSWDEKWMAPALDALMRLATHTEAKKAAHQRPP